jgi:hypothetical protein
MLDLNLTQIGAIVHCSREEAAALHDRGLRHLESRLHAAGQQRGDDTRAGMRRKPREAPVLHARRYALLA